MSGLAADAADVHFGIAGVNDNVFGLTSGFVEGVLDGSFAIAFEGF